MLEMYLDYAMMHKEPMDDGYRPSEEGLEDLRFEDLKVQKFMRDGQLLIRRGNQIYTLQGQEL
jgi:hypothetical protein